MVALGPVADRKLRTYSGGMKRRVGIAQALLADPRLLIVDEPTAGLDPEERLRFRSLLAGLAGDRTVLLSTHIVDDIVQTCRGSWWSAGARSCSRARPRGWAGQAAGAVWLVRRRRGRGAGRPGSRGDPGRRRDRLCYRVIQRGGAGARGRAGRAGRRDGYVRAHAPAGLIRPGLQIGPGLVIVCMSSTGAPLTSTNATSTPRLGLFRLR